VDRAGGRAQLSREVSLGLPPRAEDRRPIS
jgi:hypothetical protein